MRSTSHSSRSSRPSSPGRSGLRSIASLSAKEGNRSRQDIPQLQQKRTRHRPKTPPKRRRTEGRWRLSKRKSTTSTAEARKSSAQALLKDLGSSVYSDLDAGRFPSLTFASRSVKNIVYDKKLQQFILGAATVKRSSGNIKHIRPFTQLLWLAYFAKKLVDEKRTSTLRDVFYSAQAFDVEFVDQAESDELITDLEVVMQMAREGMNIYPEERSSIFGDLTIEYTVPGYEGKKADMSANPDGVMIGPALTTAEFVDTDAEMVLAIEKGGLFTRFVEEKVHKKYKAILINTAGQPPRSTRYLLRRLNQELGLPVGILCDADPWGAHIAMVCKSGSVRGDEPIVVREQSGAVKIVGIGEFVDHTIGEYGCFEDNFHNEVSASIPYDVLTVDQEFGVAFKPMSAAIRHRHEGSLLTLTTASGRRVTVTDNHSVFLLSDGKLVSKPTRDIKKGELLVISRRASMENKRPIYIDVVKELHGLANDRLSPDLSLVRSDTGSRYHRRRNLSSIWDGRKVPHLSSSKVGYIIDSGSGERRAVRCPVRIWLTKKFARLLGYYTAEGWINFRGKVPANVSLCFGLHEPEVVEDAIDCIHTVFPGIHVYQYYDKDGHAVTLSFGGVPTASLFLKLCGTGHAEKQVPSIILSARRSQVLEYLRGSFGDGYITNTAGVCWKFKNARLVSQFAYLLSMIGVSPSISGDGHVVLVSGKTETQKVVGAVLHDANRSLVMEHLAATTQSSYLLPKAFPAVETRLLELRPTIGRHQYHDLRCRYTYQRLCEIRRNGVEGAIDREHVQRVLDHVVSCKKVVLESRELALLNQVRDLVLSDIAFDPVEDIVQAPSTGEYVYDISVPGVERFIGGRSGLLLHNSANSAHLRELTTPDAVWLGVWASDIVKYKLPSDKLTEIDIKRLYELKADPRYTDRMWHNELDTFLKIKKKSEQEAFARYGLSYIVDTYLPEKLQLMKSA
ncbi:MAG: hypothetical protein HY297_02015 [Thaumarchaeota archaeon]|nr:hypothetical protein [Nitrososphaerota archaeon]